MKTCQWHLSDDDLDPCSASEDLVPIIHKHTHLDGTKTSTELGQMCKFHALIWSSLHITVIS